MTTLIQRNFSGGELSPDLYARSDLDRYRTSVRTMRNFQILRSGAAANRAGTTWVAEVKDSSKAVRLIPFRFSDAQTYILEFGDQYMRVIKDSVVLSDLTLTITGITQANPAVLTYTGTDPSNGQEVRISGVVGMTEVNGRNFKVVNVNSGANTFELDYMDGTNVNSTGFGAYASGGTAERIYELSTPYVEADLFELRHDQSADVVTITHPGYQQRELRRSGDTSWTLSSISFTPGISAPGGLGGSPAGTWTKYKITAIKDETFEESVGSSVLTMGTAEPTPSGANQISWSAVSGAREYIIYRSKGGSVYGLVDIAEASPYFDIGIPPDTTQTPPDSRNPFSGSGNFPTCAAYIQQRRMFAGTTNNPEKVWGSRVGKYTNFTISTPIEDDDTVTFTVAGRQVNSIRHLLDLGRMVILTESGEWIAEGGTYGFITPTQINLRQIGHNGSSELAPIVIDAFALFVQARGNVVRDLSFDQQSPDGYASRDLTVFATHLFKNKEIVAWALQKIPNHTAWCVMQDGTMSALTYVREHQIIGWHRHDFENGDVESVASIPEGSEDYVYMIVRRTIDGKTVRYIERMNSRTIDDVADSIFVDSSLTFDGTNEAATTMTISGGTTWANDELLTLTASASFFASTDAGNAIHFYDSTGALALIFTISAYTNATVVTGFASITVPVAYRSTAFTTWGYAVDELTNLWHLEGEQVSVLADGKVAANPNNPNYETVLTVTDGSITLAKPAVKIHVGIPIIADIQTLDIDTGQITSMVDKKSNVTAVTTYVNESRGFWVGPRPPTDDDTDPVENLTENQPRANEDYYLPPALRTEPVSVNIKGEWDSGGRVFVRAIDPVPLQLLAIAPAGRFPVPGGRI